MPMMTAKWYDSIFTTLTEYRKPYKESRYYSVWEEVLNLVPSGSNILDLGCGPGQFARMCIENKYGYTGVDFSGEALRQARLVNPGVQFIQADIDRLDTLPVDYNIIDVVTFVEVLEHIDNDVRALMFYARNKPAVITLPAFMTEGHVRCFENNDEIIDRYPLFNLGQIVKIEKSRIFVCSCRYRELPLR